MTANVLYELIQIALGNLSQLSRIPTGEEWASVFEEAETQAVAGVCIAGIDRLTASNPEQMVNLPLEMKLEWIGLTEQIRQQNKHVDKQTAKIWGQLNDDGLDAAILKGQGIAYEYEELAELRQSGDIDIWVKGGYQKVCDYVQGTHPTTDVAYHRFHYDFFEDIPANVNFRITA